MELNKPYEKHILALQEMRGFLDLFFEMCYHFPKHEDSYDKCEEIYEHHFGKRRFADYESFKSQKSKFFKNLKNK